jgi:hypothetical protein
MRNETNAKDEMIACPYCLRKYKGRGAYDDHLLKDHPRGSLECDIFHDRVEVRLFDKHLKEKHPKGGRPPVQGGSLQPKMKRRRSYRDIRYRDIKSEGLTASRRPKRAGRRRARAI